MPLGNSSRYCRYVDDEAKRKAMILGTRLRQYRKDSGLTVNGLAEYSGVSSAYISRLERGLVPRPSAPTLQKLASKLSVTLLDLMGTSDADELTNARLARLVREAQRLDVPPQVMEALESTILAILLPYRERMSDDVRRELEALHRVADAPTEYEATN